jgi:non-homologous end joining protein Ku
VERPGATVKPGEVELAVRLIEDLAAPDFWPEQYADEYRQRVLVAVRQKRAGGTIEGTEPPTPSPTVDLLATLRKSLEMRRPLTKSEPQVTKEAVPSKQPTRRHRAS